MGNAGSALELNYRTAHDLVRSGDFRGVGSAMLREQQQGIDLLNRYRSSFETVQAARTQGIIINLSTEAVLALAGAGLARLQGGTLRGVGGQTFTFNPATADAQALARIRTRYTLSGRDTVAAGGTDIPGLGGVQFEGLSPALRREAGLQSLDDLYGVSRPIRSPNPNPIASRHAEEDIFNGVAQRIDQLNLTPAQLNGRTIDIHSSNAGGVCNVCYQGLGNSTATPGVVRQFSERYPTVTVRITAEGGNVRPGIPVITVRGGQIID